MARVIKKTIRTRQKADKFYPETLAKYVKTKDGKTVEEALAEGGSVAGEELTTSIINTLWDAAE